MARIPPKNQRFRTKERLVDDLFRVLTDGELHYGTKVCVLNEIFWVWTEFDGKTIGCPYWSIEASKCTSPKDLIHDHLVPKRVLREYIFSQKRLTKEHLRFVLEKLLIGVVITKNEDKKLREKKLHSSMPKEFNLKMLDYKEDVCPDPWIRYAGIIDLKDGCQKQESTYLLNQMNKQEQDSIIEIGNLLIRFYEEQGQRNKSLVIRGYITKLKINASKKSFDKHLRLNKDVFQCYMAIHGELHELMNLVFDDTHPLAKKIAISKLDMEHSYQDDVRNLEMWLDP